MLQSTQQQLDQFLRYPAGKVIGVVDTPAQLERVLQLLADAGIDRSAITVFAGEEGIRCVDPRGAYHGLLSRLTRVVQALGHEREHLERYEEELRAGHYIVVVSAPDEASKDRVAKAFDEGGGHFVDYYGSLMMEHLVA